MQALRFGAQQKECLKAIDIAFELAPRPCHLVYKGAMETLAMVTPQVSAPPKYVVFCIIVLAIPPVLGTQNRV